MAITVETVASEALQLPKDQRLTLAHRLLSSVEPVLNPTVEAAWDAEIRERIRRYDAGETKVIPAKDVFRDLDARLAR